LNFIITGLDQKYWNPWGASWVASLKELADTKATIVVIDHGLTKNTKDRLAEYGVVVYKSTSNGEYKNATISTIIDLSEQMEGNFVYYDADVWFQRSVDDVFDKIEDKILISKNANSGFLAGNTKCFQKYKMASKLAGFIKDDKIFDCFATYFDYNLNFIDDRYNFTNLPDLTEKENELYHGDDVVHAIHPTGILKKISLNKNLFFYERYPDLHKEYVYCEKNRLPKKLLPKS